MTSRRRSFFVLAVAALAGPALAQAPASPSAAGKPADAAVTGTAHKPPEVVIVAPVDPKVVSTFPADGGKASGGVIVLKVVFDQAMTAEAWSFGQVDDGAFPNCLKKPRLLADVHVFALLCTVAPRQSYTVQINATPDFVSAHGRAAKPFLLHFTTTDDTTYDMHQALKQAGLTDADEPIMTWNAAPGGVSSQTAPPKSPTP
jgi:hypothetical protein